MQTETWKPIPSLCGYYSASSLGRIRRDQPAQGAVVGKSLAFCLNKFGYYKVGVRCPLRVGTAYVHCLVAEAFHGPKPAGMEVNHINTVRSDNRPENLEYLTRKENLKHSYDLGKNLRKLDKSKLNLLSELIKSGKGSREIASLLSLSTGYVNEVKRGAKLSKSLQESGKPRAFPA